MKVDKRIRIFGDVSYRGKCNQEETDQINWVSWLQEHYPHEHRLMVHPKNEGSRSGFQADLDRKTGSLNKGASDCVIPGCPSFVVELKRKDHTKSRWQTGQQEYLIAAAESGCFVGVAFGFEAMKEAFLEWKSIK